MSVYGPSLLPTTLFYQEEAYVLGLANIVVTNFLRASAHGAPQLNKCVYHKSNYIYATYHNGFVWMCLSFEAIRKSLSLWGRKTATAANIKILLHKHTLFIFRTNYKKKSMNQHHQWRNVKFDRFSDFGHRSQWTQIDILIYFFHEISLETNITLFWY